MDNEYYRNEAMHIINELYDEFSKEATKLKIKYDNNCAKLEELDQQIRHMAKTEDVEMRVFSPRRNISTETDKVTTLKNDRELLDKTNREVERDLRYYSKRAEKISYLSDVLERNESQFFGGNTSEVPSDTDVVESKSSADSSVSISDLEKIQSRLDNCYHFIDGDPGRAKLEIKNLMILLTELIVKND